MMRHLNSYPPRLILASTEQKEQNKKVDMKNDICRRCRYHNDGQNDRMYCEYWRKVCSQVPVICPMWKYNKCT